jgi:hypothetical protein
MPAAFIDLDENTRNPTSHCARRLTHSIQSKRWKDCGRSFATMCAAVKRFDGTVVRVMGDAIMALFGAPQGLYQVVVLLHKLNWPTARPSRRVDFDLIRQTGMVYEHSTNARLVSASKVNACQRSAGGAQIPKEHFSQQSGRRLETGVSATIL